jgi:hypothetical protein
MCDVHPQTALEAILFFITEMLLTKMPPLIPTMNQDTIFYTMFSFFGLPD